MFGIYEKVYEYILMTHFFNFLGDGTKRSSKRVAGTATEVG